MWGYRTHAWGSEPIWEEIADPAMGPDDVLIQVEACGVGRTVLNTLAGQLSDEDTLLPRVPGHEFTGIVVDAGPDHRSLLGKRIVTYFYLFCGQCLECNARREQRCLDLGGWVGCHRDGGYAPLVALPGRNAIPIPDDLDPVSATVIPDAVATPVHVAKRAKIGADDVVAVIGAGGGVGAHMIQVAKLRGAEVLGLEVREEKLRLIADLGALPMSSASFSRLGAEIGPRAPTVVIDLIGSEESLGWGRAVLAPGGRQVLLTTFPGDYFPLQPRELVFAELSVIGSRYATRADVAVAAGLVHDGSVQPVIGRVGRPREALLIHEELRRQAVVGRGAIDWRE